MMRSEKLPLERSLKESIDTNDEAKTFGQTMKMDHRVRSVGPRRNAGRGKHGKRTGWKSWVCVLSPYLIVRVQWLIPTDGEQNVFHQFYDNDLDSDVDSVEEMPTPRKKVAAASSISPMPNQTERLEMLRRVARMNKEVRPSSALVVSVHLAYLCTRQSHTKR